ncbi:MAG TPA: hypothetical protein VK922_00870 [Gemmatimonadaceae bacterium]|nr:hypothetical protein [Gemmatimonadaceae bacterium]
MARPPLTGAGMQRIQTLEEAGLQLQTLHGIVEKMAMALRAQQPLQPFVQQLRRASVPLADTLKGHYGTLADQVTMLYLVATRGGGDRVRVNNLREAVGSLRNALDIATRKVYEDHAESPEQA